MNIKISFPAFPISLTVVFIILQMTHVINWSWWWIISPLWIGIALWIFIIVFVIIIGTIGVLAHERKNR